MITPDRNRHNGYFDGYFARKWRLKRCISQPQIEEFIQLFFE
jgi:hypothetical protein